MLGTINSEGKFVASDKLVYSGVTVSKDSNGNENTNSDGLWKSKAYSAKEEEYD